VRFAVCLGLPLVLTFALHGIADATSPPAADPQAADVAPPLRNAALFSPIPGGYIGGWAGDTGLDIAASFRPVYALAAGTIDYSEYGHTLWRTGKDTAFSVRLKLDVPIPRKDRHGKEHMITHVYYTHLSKLVRVVAEDADPKTKPHVAGGERIATSGIGNGVAHLHLGLLLDGQVEQDSWDTLLVEDEIRGVMGGYKNGELLPAVAASKRPTTPAGAI
jgi:murein DD-endopeptidase MepM/ murein hydrolase activator NlpD